MQTLVDIFFIILLFSPLIVIFVDIFGSKLNKKITYTVLVTNTINKSAKTETTKCTMDSFF